MLNSFLRRKQINYNKKKLLSEIEEVKSALDLARNNFEQVLDPELIDCYIYELNAAQLRYQSLLKTAKQAEN
ncbi:hypothetical protein FACS189418_9070 [Clostridia bacterium]|nr:hypothetical protein FACS189418_9070 [Clostridia bacterium]